MTVAEIFSHPWAAAATLALVHFLWQGLAIAAALLAVVQGLGIRRPQGRYACSLAALVLMAACPLATLAVVGAPAAGEWGREAGIGGRESVAASQAPVSSAIRNPSRAVASSTIAAMQPYVLAAWLAGVAFFGGRLLLGVVGVQGLRRERLPLSRELAQRVEQFGRRLGMRARSMVFLSRRVSEAIAVGVVKPLVLVPAAWASEMPLDLLEAVIAHELAHLQRRDLWVVLLERVVQTLLFYHPAVWWLSGRLRAERELCCDELAVALTGRRLEYVQALESVARWGTRVEPLLAAGIRGERNMQVLQRVRNVLGIAAAGESSRLWPAGLVALLLPLAAWGWSAGLIAPQPSAAVADDEKDDDDKDVRKEGAKERDDDDGPDAKERERDEKDGDREEKEVRKDGDGEKKVVRKDGDDPAAAARKRERIEQLKFLNKEEDARRDGVRKEGPKDGEARKEGPKDGEARKEGPRDGEPRKVVKEGERREIRIELKGAGDGEGKLAELAAMVKKLMAENERLRAELAEIRGQKLPAKEKFGAAFEKEALIKKPAAEKEVVRDKEVIREKEAAAREKEAAVREKEAFFKGVDAAREKDALIKRAAEEKELAVARARKIKEAGERKEAELRERKIKEAEDRAAEAEERARAAAKKAEAAERAAKEKASEKEKD
jgi:beta-lactamase regulating signal transducer with metallopeptidase domain